MSYSAIASEGFNVLRDFFTKPLFGQMVESISHGSQCHTGNDLQASKQYINCNLANYTKDLYMTLALCVVIIIVLSLILSVIAFGKLKKIYYNLTALSNISRQQTNQHNHQIQSVSLGHQIPMLTTGGTDVAPQTGIARMIPPAPQAQRQLTQSTIPSRVIKDNWVKPHEHD